MRSPSPSPSDPAMPPATRAQTADARAGEQEYVYQLPAWDLMPPAAFVIRRVRRLTV
jgi:hypothetical protein